MGQIRHHATFNAYLSGEKEGLWAVVARVLSGRHAVLNCVALDSLGCREEGVTNGADEFRGRHLLRLRRRRSGSVAAAVGGAT